LSFKNPLFNNQIIPRKEEDDSESDHEDNQTQTDSSKALYFINSLCIESLKNSSSSSQQSLVHSTSQQPLFVLNNGYMTRSTQSLASSLSNINTPITTKNPLTTYYYLKTNEDFSGHVRRPSISSSQQPPKMGVKALNHPSSTKVTRNRFLKKYKN
jgi:hypothetical protein